MNNLIIVSTNFIYDGQKERLLAVLTEFGAEIRYIEEDNYNLIFQTTIETINFLKLSSNNYAYNEHTHDDEIWIYLRKA